MAATGSEDASLPPSLWATTAPPAPPTLPLSGDRKTDVLVIGGGYTGLSAALHLAESGADVTVIEARAIGWGASGRNNGQVIPTLTRRDPDDIVASVTPEQGGPEKGEAFVRLIRDSADLVFALIARHGIACEAAQAGWIQPAHRPGRVRLSEKRAEQWGRRGAPVEVLDRDATARITGSEAWYGGWINRSGGRINPLAYARGLAAAAIGKGAAIFTGTPARTLERAGAAWRVTTPRGMITANRVILATNAYSDDLWPGLKQTVVPVRSYQMATAPLSDNIRRSILPEGHALSDTRGDLYFFRFDGHGRLVTGGALVVGAGHERRLHARIGRRLATVFPQIGQAQFDFVWHGYVGITTDRLPHIHELAPGVLSWVGCNGRGVGLATAIGRVLAEASRGASLAALPVPLSGLRPLPAHGFAKLLAPTMLLLYRWRDRRG